MYELMIAWKHLRARRKRSLSVVTWLSVAGVALGVTALVGGFSITSGFEQAFREKVLGITAHVFVREYGLRFERYREAEDAVLRVKGVRAASPMTFNEAMFSGRGGTAGAVVKGIIPEKAAKVLALPEYLEQGRLEDLPGRGADGLDRILLGVELARSLGVKAGDAVTLLSPLRSGAYQEGPATPHSRPFRVAGVFSAGFQEYDARLAYMELSVAQDFFGTGDRVVGLEVAVDTPLEAGAVAEDIRRALGDGEYSVMDWRRQNKNLFASLTYQRIAILVVLSVMVVLASCLVACMLIMLVLERTRDIAILKAMGARNGSILRIFITEGLAIGAVGTAIGMAVAFALCEGLLKNGIALDPKVYGIARLPVIFEPTDYLIAAAGALVITLAAAFFPAYYGARLDPVEGLRETHA